MSTLEEWAYEMNPAHDGAKTLFMLGKVHRIALSEFISAVDTLIHEDNDYEAAYEALIVASIKLQESDEPDESDIEDGLAHRDFTKGKIVWNR